MGKRGPKPKGVEHHIMTGNYRPGRHGPRPHELERGPSPWDLLALPEVMETDATLPQDEREAAAFDKMGWKSPG